MVDLRHCVRLGMGNHTIDQTPVNPSLFVWLPGAWTVEPASNAIGLPNEGLIADIKVNHDCSSRANDKTITYLHTGEHRPISDGENIHCCGQTVFAIDLLSCM